MQHILPKASSFPNLLVENIARVEIQIFQTVTWLYFGHLLRESCLEVSYIKSAACLVWCPYIVCWWRHVLYFSYDPTRPRHWGFMHTYGWELLAACHHPGSFGATGILIVKRGKMLHQKHESYKYVLPLQNWVDWITTRREKMSQPEKCTFLKKASKNWKTLFFPWRLPSNLLLI